MVSIDIFVEKNKNDDQTELLDIIGTARVIINEKPIPEEYFPNGLNFRLYETAFEALDLLGNLIDGSDEMLKAEFCYSGNYLMAQKQGNKLENVHVELMFNPRIVDDEKILDGSDYQDTVPFADLAREIMLFAILVYETIVEINPELEESMIDMQNTIFDYQQQLEEKFQISLFPPEDV